MRFKKAIIAFALIAAIALIPLVVVAKSSQQNNHSPLTHASLGWKIADAKVLSNGKTVTTDEGVIVSDYQLESQATSTNARQVISNGTLSLNITAFSPKKDMPGQTKGKWYISGSWALTGFKPAKGEKIKRHVENAIQGTLKAELDFNPVSEKGIVNAIFDVPTSTAAGRWGRGELQFTGNEKFEGTIQGDLEQWPVGKKSGQKKAQVK